MKPVEVQPTALQAKCHDRTDAVLETLVFLTGKSQRLIE